MKGLWDVGCVETIERDVRDVWNVMNVVIFPWNVEAKKCRLFCSHVFKNIEYRKRKLCIQHKCPKSTDYLFS